MSTLTHLRDVLTDQGWPFEEHPDLPVVRVEIEAERGTWELYVELREEAEQILVYAVYSVILPPERQAPLAELLHRINCDLVVGSFELDYDESAVRMRMSADMAVTPPSRLLLERLIIGNTVMMELYLGSIDAVSTGEMSVSEALAASSTD